MYNLELSRQLPVAGCLKFSRSLATATEVDEIDY